MACCGQGRAAFTPAFEAPPRPVPAGPQSDAPAGAGGVPAAAGPADAAPRQGTVRLRYGRQAGVRVRGPVSGLSYAFSGDTPVQAVDARDADGLLRTGYFRRAY